VPDNFRPLAGDPDADMVVAMFDANADDWILTTAGDYQTAAVEAMRSDGTGHQACVILEWPGRRNHTDDEVTVRLMISPDDALGLAEVLTHSARWLKEAIEP